MEVRGKIALVTGGGAGIGRAVAVRLAREGASVVVTDVDEQAGAGTVREIDSGVGRAAFFCADVTSQADARRMIAFAGEEFGGLDVLVNNAGGVSEPYFPDGDPAHWGRAIDLNLGGVMLGIHFGVRAMERRGGGASLDGSSHPVRSTEGLVVAQRSLRSAVPYSPECVEGVFCELLCPWMAAGFGRGHHAIQETPHRRIVEGDGDVQSTAVTEPLRSADGPRASGSCAGIGGPRGAGGACGHSGFPLAFPTPAISWGPTERPGARRGARRPRAGGRQDNP